MNIMKCVTEDCFNPVENNDTGLCASCGRAIRKSANAKVKAPPKPIMRVSKGLGRLTAIYLLKKSTWIKNKRCAVAPENMATDVHHMKGRLGFADQWARDNNINLLIDERFWLPVSRVGHDMIERNPEWAKRMGYSLNRLDKE